MVDQLIKAGANVRTTNRRGAQPLHSAAVGSPGSPTWDPVAQTATIVCLIEAGADPFLKDASGHSAKDLAKQIGFNGLAIKGVLA